MPEKFEVNYLIGDTINAICPDENVKRLIKRVLQYELDTYNRHPRKADIMEAYQQIVNKTYREMEL